MGGLVILVDHDPWFYSPGCKRNPGPNHLTDISQRSFHVHRVTEGSLFRDDEEAEDQGKSVLSVQGLRILQMLERKKREPLSQDRDTRYAIRATSHTCLRTTSSSKGTCMEKPFVPLGYPCSRIRNPAALHSSTVRTPVEKVMFFSTTSLRKAPNKTLNTRSSGSVSEEPRGRFITSNLQS